MKLPGASILYEKKESFLYHSPVIEKAELGIELSLKDAINALVVYGAINPDTFISNFFDPKDTGLVLSDSMRMRALELHVHERCLLYQVYNELKASMDTFSQKDFVQCVHWTRRHKRNDIMTYEQQNEQASEELSRVKYNASFPALGHRESRHYPILGTDRLRITADSCITMNTCMDLLRKTAQWAHL